MIINLPENLENFLRAAVQSGQFASVDEAMTKAVHLLRQQLQERQPAPQANAADQAPATEARKPIWERILERSAAIPDEEWEKLPIDGAEQHDHYIYGTPKRLPSQ
jgi:Arc/MetJ-type ribon-helix-helix transcriptional regulator